MNTPDITGRMRGQLPAAGLPPEVKEEFQRRRDRLERDTRERADPSLRKEGMDALYRLIAIAQHDTDQSKRVADFLLAWWNAANCGGFDLTDIWSVDSEIADDMMLAISFIRRTRAYPDVVTPQIHEAFKGLVRLWRPHLGQS